MQPDNRREPSPQADKHDADKPENWFGEFLAGFREGFGSKSRHLAVLLCLSAGLVATSAVRAETSPQAPFQLAASGERIDTDINHDGKDDLKQIGQGVKDFSKKIDPQAKKVGSVIEQKTDEIGHELVEGGKQVRQNVDQKFDQFQHKVNDLNDRDQPGYGNWTWVFIALIVVALLAVAIAASRRRSVTYFR